MSERYIVLPALDGKKVALGSYIQAVRHAKAHPETTFKHGLTCWWPCTGREVLTQFLDGVHNRINAGIPYVSRGQGGAI